MIREFFFPTVRIPIHSDEELEEYKTLYNGKKNIYESLYAFNGDSKEDINATNAIVDKIFLDFDYDDDFQFFNDVKKVVKFLNELNLYYYIRFSGRGFHVFIKLANVQLKNPKQAIRSWVKELHQKTNTQSDTAVIGDLRRVCRIMGSMNMKTHLHCIPVDYAHLMNCTYESICEMAKEYDSSIHDIYHYGQLLDISEYDKEECYTPIQNINTDNIKITTEHPPCIQDMLSNKELGYYARGQLILYLRDDGYGLHEILTILKAILSNQKYYHCTEEEKQPFYLYYREDMVFASCKTLKDNGLCCSDACKGHYLYI